MKPEFKTQILKHFEVDRRQYCLYDKDNPPIPIRPLKIRNTKIIRNQEPIQISKSVMDTLQEIRILYADAMDLVIVVENRSER